MFRMFPFWCFSSHFSYLKFDVLWFCSDLCFYIFLDGRCQSPNHCLCSMQGGRDDRGDRRGGEGEMVRLFWLPRNLYHKDITANQLSKQMFTFFLVVKISEKPCESVWVCESIHVVLLQEAPEEQKEPEKSEKAKDMVHLAFSKNHRNYPHPWLWYRWNLLLVNQSRHVWDARSFGGWQKSTCPWLKPWLNGPGTQHRSTAAPYRKDGLNSAPTSWLLCSAKRRKDVVDFYGLVSPTQLWPSTFPNLVHTTLNLSWVLNDDILYRLYSKEEFSIDSIWKG